MKVALVGPEIEENLALRYIASSLEHAGHEIGVFDFHERGQISALARGLIAWQPDVIGLSMIFTVRSREFIALAKRVRDRGYRGHITAGGHFAALHAEQLLAGDSPLDTIVLGEGEAPMVELADNLATPQRVAGLVYRDRDGAVRRTGCRPNDADLDARPWPKRPDRFHAYLGHPIANLLSSRGCYAACSFCSISAFHRNNGGQRFRRRDVAAVAAEMAHLYHDRGVRIFNFQDDNFLVPRRSADLARYRALKRELDRAGVGRIGIQAKARPDCIDPEVIDLLASIGLFRMFLGVETDAVVGLRTLGRGIERGQNHRALDILRQHEIHTCFNLLIFDPESTFEAVRQNIEFMRRQSYFPLNFCRVEVYAGTPLEARLRAEGRLRGDLFGYSYAIRDQRVQLAYEMFRDVFWARNFGKGGMHHESMKLDYNFHVLRHFRPELATRARERQVKQLVLALNRDSAATMARICEVAESPDAFDDVARARTVAELRAARERFDREIGRSIEAALRRIEVLAGAPPRRRRFLQSTAAAALLATAAGCGGKSKGNGHTHMCEMAPPPPRPPDVKLGAEQQELVRAALQQRVDAELYPIIEEMNLQGLPISLSISVNEYGELIGCEPADASVQEVANRLCERLLGTEIPGLPRGEYDVGYANVALQWPVRVPDERDDLRDDDTHMCEMAPPPNDGPYAPEPIPDDPDDG